MQIYVAIFYHKGGYYSYFLNGIITLRQWHIKSYWYAMKRLLIILLACCQLAVSAKDVSPQAKKLRYYYEQLQRQPHAPVIHMQFIQAFPNNKKDFIDVFNHHTHDQLAASAEDYVKRFRKLGYDYTDSVLQKSIIIGVELAAWSDGPVNELQKTIYYLTNKKPMLLVEMTRKLTKSQQNNLAQFLRSGPDGKENENYPTLLDIFDKADKRILKVFTEAKMATEEIEGAF